MSPDELIQRGERARQIINDPLYIEAWEGLEIGCVERLAACDTNDAKTLQALTQSLQTVRAVRRRMAVWIAEGQEAAERLMRKEQQQPTLLSRFRRSA